MSLVASKEFFKKQAHEHENRPLTGDAKIIHDLRDKNTTLEWKIKRTDAAMQDLRLELLDERRKYLRFRVTVAVIVCIFASFALFVASK